MEMEKSSAKELEDDSDVTTLAPSELSLELADFFTSTFSSESNLDLKLKHFDLKPHYVILPEKTGTRLTRYLQCKFSHGSTFAILN